MVIDVKLSPYPSQLLSQLRNGDQIIKQNNETDGLNHQQNNETERLNHKQNNETIKLNNTAGRLNQKQYNEIGGLNHKNIAITNLLQKII